jgi:hypothetical protein
MNITASNQNIVSVKEQGFKEQYQTKVSEYMAK